MKYICNKQGLDYKKIFDEKFILLIIIGFVLTTIIVVFLYLYPLIRYLIASIILLCLVINYRKVLEIIKVFLGKVK